MVQAASFIYKSCIKYLPTIIVKSSFTQQRFKNSIFDKNWSELLMWTTKDLFIASNYEVLSINILIFATRILKNSWRHLSWQSKLNSLLLYILIKYDVIEALEQRLDQHRHEVVGGMEDALEALGLRYRVCCHRASKTSNPIKILPYSYVDLHHCTNPYISIHRLFRSIFLPDDEPPLFFLCSYFPQHQSCNVIVLCLSNCFAFCVEIHRTWICPLLLASPWKQSP